MYNRSLRARLHYAFDNTLSHGPVAIIGWLGLASAGLILLVSIVVKLGGFAPSTPLVDVMWMSLLRTLDDGTMGADHGSWPFLISMLLVTFGGIFVVSVLIGVITSSLEETLEGLRKGRSQVVESNHTVILGWSHQVFSILDELAIANANQPNSCIVVLADQDKVEMEDEIRAHVGPRPDPDHLSSRQSDRHGGSRDRQPADLTFDHHPGARE